MKYSSPLNTAMRFLGLAAFGLLLLSLPSSHGRITTFRGEPFNCNNASDYFAYDFLSCESFRVFPASGILFDGYGITGNTVLNNLQPICRNQTKFDAYRNCMAELVTECPEFSHIFETGPEERISMLCNGTEVAPWLVNVLQRVDYFGSENFRRSPDNIAMILENTCPFPNLKLQKLSFMDAVEAAPGVFNDYFYCLKDRYSAKQDLFESYDVNLTWQAELLEEWLGNLWYCVPYIYITGAISEFNLPEKLQSLW